MSRIYITQAILSAMNAISEHGHGVALEEDIGKNNEINTYLIICVRHPLEDDYINKLKIQYVIKYQLFCEFVGVGDEFEDLNCYGQPTVKPFLELISRHIDDWLEKSKTSEHLIKKIPEK